MRMAADEFTSTRRVDPIPSNDIVTEDSAALTFVDQRGHSLRLLMGCRIRAGPLKVQ